MVILTFVFAWNPKNIVVAEVEYAKVERGSAMVIRSLPNFTYKSISPLIIG